MRKVLLTGAALLLCTFFLTGCLNSIEAPSSPVSASNSGSLFDEEAIIALYERCIPAVVLIDIAIGDSQIGQGSGFLIDHEGNILTNYHVVENATAVSVYLHDGQTLDAEVIGTDRENDLALIRVDAAHTAAITPLTLGDSAAVRPGQLAIALGSPYWLEGSITAGIISGVGRPLTGSSLRTITDVLQTDASINPGNSGGPLLNSSGEVVGINTALESATGIGFAIPINTARDLLSELLKGGEVATPWLGLQSLDITEALASELELPVNRGMYVVEVIVDSPAAQAGIVGSGIDAQGGPVPGGDIVTAIDGQAVVSVDSVLTYLNGKRPGDVVTLTIQRGDSALTVPVTLGEWPESFD